MFIHPFSLAHSPLVPFSLDLFFKINFLLQNGFIFIDTLRRYSRALSHTMHAVSPVTDILNCYAH